MAGKGKGPLRIALEDFLDTFGFGKKIHDWVNSVLEDFEDGAVDIYSGLLKRLDIEDKIHPALLPKNLIGGKKKHQIGVGMVLTAAGGLVIGLIVSVVNPVRRLLEYQAERLFKTARYDPASAWSLALRDPAQAAKYFDDLKDLGWSDERIAAFRLILQPILPPLDLETLRLKGAITQADYDAEMGRLGYTISRIDQVQALRQVIPGPGDLVSMAVREAWNEDVAARFKYDEAFPPEFGEWMTKQGLSTDWARRYWRAHWTLPGVNQAFEMFQRLRPGRTDKPFTADDLSTFMRTADIPEFFRDRLSQVAYSPLTRVDVRRMFGTGTLDEDGVRQSYLDLGYNAKDADLMTDFTTKFEKSAQKDLTRAAIIGAYTRGQISRADTLAKLGDIGYDKTNAEFFVSIADYDISAIQVDEKLAVIKARYINRDLTESTVMDAMGPLNLPAERQRSLLELWTVSRDNKIAIPSRSELDDFLRRAIIAHDAYRKSLSDIGYLPATVELYVRRIDLIMQNDANINAERAQTERDRILRSKLSSDYARSRAEINVDVAEARAAIADINVALHGEITPEEADLMKTRIYEIKAQIAQYNLETSQLKLGFEIEKAK